MPVASEAIPASGRTVSRRYWWRAVGQSVKTAVPLVIADIVALLICFAAASLAMFFLTDWFVAYRMANQFLAIGAVYFLVGMVFGLFPASGMSPPFEMRQQVTAVLVSFGVLLVLNSLFGHLSRAEAASILASAFVSAVVLPVTRFFCRAFLGRAAWWGERVVIVGANRQGRRLATFLRNVPQRGLRPVGFIDEPSDYWRGVEDDGSSPVTDGLRIDDDPAPYLGPISELPRVVRDQNVGWAVVSLADRSPAEVTETLTHCGTVPNLVVLPSRAMLPSLWTRSRECGGMTGLHIRDALLQPVPRILKRAGDIAVSATGLLLMAPVIAVFAVWIKRRSPGPVFYADRRVGRGGKEIHIWKFRTMVPNADARLREVLDADPDAAAEYARDSKLKQDPRIIPGVGHVLRKFSLDELPQLWNVLNGTMSLVGPRPIHFHDISKYRELHTLRQRVRPGITGLWQISGRNNTSFEHRVSLDSYYVRNWSPWLDAYILLRTVRTIVMKEGAY